MTTLATTIQHATFIRATPERVYDTFTQGAAMDRWFTTGARIDAHAGGEIVFRWQDWGPDHITATDGGPVLEAARPTRFVFQWHPDGPDYATTVALTFVERDGGTVVSLQESGYADTASGQQALAGCAAGWGEALTLLKFYIEHGVTYNQQ